MTATSLESVTVSFAGRVALDDVSLAVEAGSVTAVVGGDGAGKTTLLRTLVGLVRPDRGWVRRPPTREVGYFSSNGGVFDDLTVDENLRFVASSYHVADPTRPAELLRDAGLAGVAGRLARHLSGGMRHKLGLVMAMVHRPALLVLDEPTTGVDPVSRADLNRMILRGAAAGSSVLFTTAHLDDAVRANRVVVLDRGSILRSGTAAAITAAVPGRVVSTRTQPTSPRSWRRGRRWHVWVDEGEPLPAGAAPVTPDLEDAVIVAALQRSPT